MRIIRVLRLTRFFDDLRPAQAIGTSDGSWSGPFQDIISQTPENSIEPPRPSTTLIFSVCSLCPPQKKQHSLIGFLQAQKLKEAQSH